MINIRKHLDLLGKKVEDRVTGRKGIVTTIAFDLYGCIQATVNPGIDKSGNPKESLWYDVSRLKVLNENPVMDRPNFEYGSVAEGKQGAADKPRYQKA